MFTSKTDAESKSSQINRREVKLFRWTTRSQIQSYRQCPTHWNSSNCWAPSLVDTNDLRHSTRTGLLGSPPFPLAPHPYPAPILRRCWLVASLGEVRIYDCCWWVLSRSWRCVCKDCWNIILPDYVRVLSNLVFDHWSRLKEWSSILKLGSSSRSL